MRAHEFIVERKGGKMTQRQQNPTRGINKFTDNDRWNSDYKLYRLGLALAPCDGVNDVEMDEESWIGRFKAVFPYSEKEQDMIHIAARAAGVNILDVNKGDMRSLETDDTYKTSPVANWMKK